MSCYVWYSFTLLIIAHNKTHHKKWFKILQLSRITELFSLIPYLLLLPSKWSSSSIARINPKCLARIGHFTAWILTRCHESAEGNSRMRVIVHILSSFSLNMPVVFTTVLLWEISLWANNRDQISSWLFVIFSTILNEKLFPV